MLESKSSALPLGDSPIYYTKVGWIMGLEPMTSSATNWRSTNWTISTTSHFYILIYLITFVNILCKFWYKNSKIMKLSKINSYFKRFLCICIFYHIIDIYTHNFLVWSGYSFWYTWFCNISSLPSIYSPMFFITVLFFLSQQTLKCWCWPHFVQLFKQILYI